MLKRLAAAALLALLPTVALPQALLLDGTVVVGHLNAGLSPTTSPPATTSCTLVAGSTDFRGQCAATATSAVAVTFSKAFAAAPFCVVLDHTTASGNALATEPNTTTFVMGTTVSGDKISWICIGQPAN